MWETAERAGIKTANLMWAGPPITSSGTSSTYFIPFRDKVPLQEKLDQILQWIDMDIDERPQLILGTCLTCFLSIEHAVVVQAMHCCSFRPCLIHTLFCVTDSVVPVQHHWIHYMTSL